LIGTVKEKYRKMSGDFEIEMIGKVFGRSMIEAFEGVTNRFNLVYDVILLSHKIITFHEITPN
jgi:hypothetical protein